MRKFMLLVSFLLMLVFGRFILSRHQRATNKGERTVAGILLETSTSSKQKDRLKLYAKQLKLYAKSHHFNSSVCFLADMNLPGGKNRFFVYDLVKDSIKYAGLVAHGGGATGALNAVFSNEPNSGYSSSGRYKTGVKYKGRFGTAFKLHGLDSSNSNAYKRFVVLHSYSCVPDYEVYPAAICNSLGCPMVSVKFLKLLEHEIGQSEKPVLLWIMQ